MSKNEQEARRNSKTMENQPKIPAKMELQEKPGHFSHLADLITNKSNELCIQKPCDFAETSVGFAMALKLKEPKRSWAQQKLEATDFGATLADKFSLIFKKDQKTQTKIMPGPKPNVSQRLDSYGTNKSFGNDPTAQKRFYLNTDWGPSNVSTRAREEEARGRTSENVYRRKEAMSLSKQIRNAMRKLEF